jgi:hypothetical protein
MRLFAALPFLLLAACFSEIPREAADKAGPGTPEDSGSADDTGTAPDCEVDDDLDGSCAGDDCNDGDPDVFPGAGEACNEVDDDCDGAIDEGVGGVYYVDEDGDGYGAPEPVEACEPPDDTVDNGADCDDADADAHPGAEERGNGADDDCDGEVDEGVTVDPLSVVLTWSNRGVVVEIENGSGRYDFGMAETGVGEVGWFGESCVIGEEPLDREDYGYDICHGLTATGGEIVHVDNINDADDGSTLFTEEIHDRGNITYVLFDDSGAECWVWGDDVRYYEDFGCTEL